jgi:glyoxylate reductase
LRSFEPARTLLIDRIDEELPGTAWPQLKVVANYAVGFDNTDLQAFTQRGCWPATRRGC